MDPDDLGYFATTRTSSFSTPPPPAPVAPSLGVPQHPGWAPPVGHGPPPPTPESESGIGAGEALLVTGLVLLASLVLNVGLRNPAAASYDHLLRKGLVYTLFFYLIVGVAVGAYVLLRKVRLVWFRGSVLHALVLGLPVGIGGGVLAVALNSAIRGHLSGDPGVELLVGGGGALRILLTLVVTAVLAPLVEETAFRAICAGSLTTTGAAAALWVSALAFAVWHMRPESLRYYALMGLLLGRLWQKRGLIASMSAHACFNGVLTVVAVMATQGAGTYTTYGGAHFELPGGWHERTTTSVSATYVGPAGASLAVAQVPDPRMLTADEIVERLRTQGSALASFGIDQDASKAVVVTLGGREAVQVDVTVGNQPGHMLLVPMGGTVYSFVIVTGGSPRAEHDWVALEKSLDIRG